MTLEVRAKQLCNTFNDDDRAWNSEDAQDRAAWRRLAARTQPLPPAAPSAEPNDWKLPHDFVAAGATFRKGVSAKTLALRVENLWTAAFGPMPTKAEQDANFVRLTGVTTPAVAPALERETAEPPALIDEPKEPAGSFELGRAHGITHVVDSLHANPEKWGYRAIASTPPPEQASTPNEAPPEGEQPG